MPYKNFTIVPQLQCLRESYETFGIWWGHRYLQNVYLGFLISMTLGQVIFVTWPKVIDHFKSMGKELNSLFYASSCAYMNGIASGKVFIDTPSEIFSRGPRSWRSLEVTNSFLPITWDPNEIETWDWCHCVCLRKAHRMMYNLTYLGHRVTFPWLDLRSNFDLDLSRSNYTWFDAPWRDKHDGIKIVALPLKLKILSSKNRFGKFWNFDPWWPQFCPEPKNDRNDFEMIFRELSNAVFRFVLRCAGAEIDGGVQIPPIRWWKIQRPIRARVKMGRSRNWPYLRSQI